MLIKLLKTLVYSRYTLSLKVGLTDTTKKLWKIDIPHSPKHDSIKTISLQANNAYTQKILQDLVSYLHQAASSPVPSTWIKDIDTGFFATWPSLTSDLVRIHIPKSIATAKGHMRKTKMNIRSTKTILPPPAPTDNFPAVIKNPEVRQSEVLLRLLQIRGKIAIYQMGLFPKASSNGTR